MSRFLVSLAHRHSQKVNARRRFVTRQRTRRRDASDECKQARNEGALAWRGVTLCLTIFTSASIEASKKPITGHSVSVFAALSVPRIPRGHEFFASNPAPNPFNFRDKWLDVPDNMVFDNAFKRR